MNELAELWIEHSQTTFPKGFGGREVQGVCVTTIDSYAAGCLHTYMNGEKNELDLERYQILSRCKTDLENIVGSLDGEPQQYFGRLYELCSLVLAEAEIA